jgi:hypothetical protein
VRPRLDAMRLAILATSSYATCAKLPELPHAELTLELLAQRLGEPDAGFAVQAFSAERGFAEAAEQAIASCAEPVDALFLFFQGYVVLSAERGPALLLDGERPSAFSIKRLRRVLGERPAFVVLDTLNPPGTADQPNDVLQALAAALADDRGNTHFLAANRSDTNGASSPFSHLLELVLDWQAVKSVALTPDGLYAAMRAEEGLFRELEAVEFVAGSSAFELLVPVTGIAHSLPPSAEEAALPPDERVEGDEHARAVAELRACLDRGDHAAAAQHVAVAARSGARDPEVYRLSIELSQLDGRRDGAWNAASALRVLGVANPAERALAESHVVEALLSPQAVLTEKDWRDKALCPERDELIDELIASISDAITEIATETARRKRRLPAVSAASLTDPQKSTTMLARTLLWSSRLLGLPTPELHVLEGKERDIEVIAAATPTVVVSKALGSGLKLPELACLWARKLVSLRHEHRAFGVFPESELAELLRVAHAFGARRELPRGLDADGKLFGRALKRHVRGPVLDRLSAIASRLPANEVAPRLRRSVRAVERAGLRAALLASGSVEVAAAVLQRFPESGRLSEAERLDTLLVFTVSREYGALRERLGVALPYTGERSDGP